METKFNSREAGALDLYPAVAEVLTKIKSVEAKREYVKADLDRLKKELAFVETELTKVDAIRLAGKMSAKENDVLREQLDMKRIEIESQIRTQNNNLKSALQALEILEPDLTEARAAAVAEACEELDAFLAKHKNNISKLIDSLLEELGEAREVFLKRSKVVGAFMCGNPLVHFHNVRFPEIMKIVEALKSIGETEIILKHQNYPE